MERVNSFVYLGSSTSSEGNVVHEILIRTLGTRLVLGNPRHLSSKGRYYRPAVRSVVLYGCESWPFLGDPRRLTDLDHRCLRSLARVWQKQHVSNDEVRRTVFEINSAPLKRIVFWVTSCEYPPRACLIALYSGLLDKI